MGLAFASFVEKACCLCGATDGLTGEHKIKASALRSVFGQSPMVIGRFDGSKGGVRSAQGVKSKALHFTARLCALCNNSRTQPADREFDLFHDAARTLFDTGSDPISAFDDPRYEIGSGPYLDVFRYFAKLLACHLAELGAPRPRHLAAFAIGSAHQNCVWLAVNEDWTYRQMADSIGPHQYAAHGGLVVYGDKKTGNATAFHSTLTVGPLRYVFHSRLNPLQQLELRLLYPDFNNWCRDQVKAANENPMSDVEKLVLGFAVDEPDAKSS